MKHDTTNLTKERYTVEQELSFDNFVWDKPNTDTI